MAADEDSASDSASVRLTDEAILLALILERLARYISDDISVMLNDLRNDILTLVVRLDPTSLRYEANRRTRLMELIEQAQKAISDAYVAIADRTDRHLLDVADLTQESSSHLLGLLLLIKGLSRKLDRDALAESRDSTLIEGATIREWWARQSGDMQFRLRRDLEEAMRIQELGDQPTLDDLVQPIRSNQPGSLFLPVIRNIQGLIYSAVHAVASSVRLETIVRHPELFAALQHISVMDQKTSLICRQRNNLLWDVNGNPIGHKLPFRQPPLHWNSLPAGTLIQTQSGPMPIEEISPGVMVLTHRGRYRRVLAVMSKACETKVIRVIRTETGRVLRATDEHPVLTMTSGWKRADQIKVGDQLFEDAEQFSRKKFPSCVVGKADNYPPPFHQTDVFSNVRFDPTVMSSSVYFEHNLRNQKSKVSNCSINDKLVFERHPGFCECIQKRLFCFGDVGSVLFGDIHVYRMSSRLIDARILLGHSLAGPRVQRMGVFCFAESPVIFPGFYESGSRNDKLASVYPTSDLDSVFSAPVGKAGFPCSKSPLQLPDRDVLSKVVSFDKFDNSPFIPQIERTHWTLSSVVSADFAFYPSTVYNIEVEEDNTYVADGVLVHNCRSHLVPVMHPYQDLPPRIQRRIRDQDFDGRSAAEPNLAVWLAAHGITRDDEPIDFDDARKELGV